MKTPRRSCRQQSNHVLCIVTDAHNCLPMTEELIDTWWKALAPEAKAEVYEAALDIQFDLPESAERLSAALTPALRPSFTACGVTSPRTLEALSQVAAAALDTAALRDAIARGEEALRTMLDLAGKDAAHV